MDAATPSHGADCPPYERRRLVLSKDCGLRLSSPGHGIYSQAGAGRSGARAVSRL